MTDSIELAAAGIPKLLTASLIRKHYIPISARTLWRWVSQGKFPEPDLRNSQRAVYWKRETVEAWIESRALATA